MDRTKRMIGVATLCLGAGISSSHAQLIEITIDSRDLVSGTAHAVVLFDTTAPQTEFTATSVTFEAYDASLSVDFANFYHHGPGHAEQPLLRKAGVASLTYTTQGRELVIRVETIDCTLELEVESPVGPFHPYMTALPENPSAYLFDGFDTQRVRAFFTETLDEQTTRTGEALWNPIDAFTGALAYTVRTLPAPEPERCTEADLAPPFGVLDFDDVLAFIDAFSAACSADD